MKCQLWTLIGGASESSMQEGAAAAAAALPTSRKNDTVKRQVLPGAQDNTLRFEVHQLCGKLGLHTESSESADGRVVFAWKPEGWKWGFGPKNAPSSKKRKRKKNKNKSNKRWVKQCDDDSCVFQFDDGRLMHDCYRQTHLGYYSAWDVFEKDIGGGRLCERHRRELNSIPDHPGYDSDGEIIGGYGDEEEYY